MAMCTCLSELVLSCIHRLCLNGVVVGVDSGYIGVACGVEFVGVGVVDCSVVLVSSAALAALVMELSC